MIHKIYNATAEVTACGKQVLPYDLGDPHHRGETMEVATPKAFGGAFIGHLHKLMMSSLLCAQSAWLRRYSIHLDNGANRWQHEEEIMGQAKQRGTFEERKARTYT